MRSERQDLWYQAFHRRGKQTSESLTLKTQRTAMKEHDHEVSASSVFNSVLKKSRIVIARSVFLRRGNLEVADFIRTRLRSLS